MSHTSREKTGSLRSGVRWSCVLLASFAWLFGCGGGGSRPEIATISKDKFITTYVALRQAASWLDSASLDSARIAILHDAGVTRQDMLTFVETHGPDVTYMKEVWDSVEQELDKGPAASLSVH